jgi:UDP-N-acetylmuramoyl-tripeptide--D-alanyl-D-alanine ligase
MDETWTLSTIFGILVVPKPAKLPDALISDIQINPSECSVGSLFISNPFILHKLGYEDESQAIKEAVINGAAAAITHQRRLPFRSATPIIRVKNTGNIFSALSNKARREFTGTVVAVTGSVGKTSTKDIVGHGLSNFGSSYKTGGNSNSFAGVCRTMINAPIDGDYLTVEVGASEPGHLRHAGFVGPNIGIITNVWASAHLDMYQNKEGLFREKASLFDHLVGPRIGIIHENVRDADRDAGSVIAGKQLDRLITVGSTPDNDIYCENTHFDGIKNSGVMRVFATPYPFELNLAGAHFIDSAMFAVATAVALDLDISTMIATIAKPEITGRRLERYRIKLKNGDIEFIDDSYNASPVSVRALVKTLALRQAPRKVLIWGDMKGLGDRTASYHSEIASMIGPENIDLVLTIGDQTEEACRALHFPNSLHFSDPEALAPAIPELIQAGDLIAAKGSGLLKITKIADIVKQLGPSTAAGNWRIEEAIS